MPCTLWLLRMKDLHMPANGTWRSDPDVVTFALGANVLQRATQMAQTIGLANDVDIGMSLSSCGYTQKIGHRQC